MTQHANANASASRHAGNGPAAPASTPQDLAELAEMERRLLGELASATSQAGAAAGASLERTRELLEEPVSGSAMPHIQAYGGLGVRLLAAQERCVRTFGQLRRHIAAAAARQGQDRPN